MWYAWGRRELHTFLVSKSEGLSAPYTGRLYPSFPGDIPSNHFC
jgi:hypothetical protein